MTKKLIIFFSAFLLLASPAAFSEEEDPRIQVIKDILEATNYRQTMDAVRDTLPQQLRTNLENAGTPFTTTQLQILEEVTLEEFQLMEREMFSVTIQLYLDVFSEQELRDMLAFYQTESGKSMAEKLPVLSIRLSQDLNRLMMEMLPRLREKLVERLLQAEESTENES